MSTLEICVVVFVFVSTAYTLFCIFRDVRHMKAEKVYLEDWRTSSKNILGLVVEMDRMRDALALLTEAEKKREAGR